MIIKKYNYPGILLIVLEINFKASLEIFSCMLLPSNRLYAILASVSSTVFPTKGVSPLSLENHLYN